MGVEDGAKPILDYYRNGVAHTFFVRDARFAIAEELLPAFENSFYPLDRTRDIIGYPPI